MPDGGNITQERETRRDSELAKLRRDIQAGLDQTRAGELVDGEEVFAGLEAKIIGARSEESGSPSPSDRCVAALLASRER
jgi:hypothetical protein